MRSILDSMQSNEPLSEQTVLRIGCKLIDKLEAIHRSGYVYNNLCPESILLAAG